MLNRQTSGSVVCPSCGRLVGVAEQRCPHCGRYSPGFWGYGRLLQVLGQDFGFVNVVIGACSLLYLVSLLLDPSAAFHGGGGFLQILSPSSESLYRLGMSGAVPVFGYHRWWTVLSASWLHGSLLHILFNMLWIRQLGPAAGRLFGTSRMILIYLAAGVAGFTLTSFAGAYLAFMPGLLRGAPATIGASAAIFGLLAALVYYGRRTGSHALGQQAWTWAIALFVFGFIMPGVDNYAHLGGFLGGYAMARWLDPLKPETQTHVLAALVGLVLSALSIVASFVTLPPR